MQRTSITYVLGIALAISPVSVALAEQPPAEVSQAKRMTATATVDHVDMEKRELRLRDEEGNHFTVQVPEDVKRFDAIKQGDRIKLDYYESIALSLKKRGEAPKAGESTMAERTPGALPGGMIGRQVTASVEVMKVDRTNHKVTVKGPKGETVTLNVSDPALRAELGKLKKGDHIQASYTEAMAISVMPQEGRESQEPQEPQEQQEMEQQDQQQMPQDQTPPDMPSQPPQPGQQPSAPPPTPPAEPNQPAPQPQPQPMR